MGMNNGQVSSNTFECAPLSPATPKLTDSLLDYLFGHNRKITPNQFLIFSVILSFLLLTAALATAFYLLDGWCSRRKQALSNRKQCEDCVDNAADKQKLIKDTPLLTTEEKVKFRERIKKFIEFGKKSEKEKTQ